MKGEIACYLLVPVVFAFIRRRPGRTTAIVSVAAAASYVAYIALSIHGGESGNAMSLLIAKQFRMITFFFIGAILNLQLQLIKGHRWIVLAMALALTGMTMLDNMLNLLLRPIADSMLVIWCCMIGTWGHFLAKCDDMTYDMYLFHYPIIQTLIAIGIMASAGLWATLVASVAATMLLSYLSGRYIGTPIAAYGLKNSRN